MNQRIAFWAVFVAAIGVTVIPGCRRARPHAGSPRSATVSSDSLAEAAAVVRGARTGVLGRAVEVKTYLPAKMYEAIDGEADLFLSYDCRGLVVGQYHAGKAIVSAEVFDQVEPVNAFGVFSQLRGEAAPVAVGAGGVQIAEEAVLFWTSRFFVRVSTGSAERPALAALVDLSRSIAARLKGPSSLPAWTEALPPAASRAQYVARNVLGHGFLTHAVIGEYRVGMATCRVVLARAADEAEARNWWRRLRDFCHGSTGSAGLAAFPSETFRGADQQGQRALATHRGRYLALAVGDCSEDRMRQLLNATLTRLKPVKS